MTPQRQGVYSQIISPFDYVRLMTSQHLYIPEADQIIAEIVGFHANNQPTNQPAEVVELGCGPIRMTPGLVGPKVALTAVDCDDGFLRYASDCIKNHNHRIRLVNAKVQEYRHDKPVHIFASQGLHHHVPKGLPTFMYLRNVADQLAPNGIYVLSDEMLPHYETEEERLTRAIIWYSHIIHAAKRQGYSQLAYEEARTLLDDLSEGDDSATPKNEEQIELVLGSVYQISVYALGGERQAAERIANELLTKVRELSGSVSLNPALQLSRGDFKICHDVLEQEIIEAGLRIVGVITIGPIHTIGGFGIYTLRKA